MLISCSIFTEMWHKTALLEDTSDTGITAYKLSVSKKVVVLYM